MRTIDYGILTGPAFPGDVTVHGYHGSDHALVVFVVYVRGGRTWRVGLWNARRDRDRDRVARVAVRLLSLLDLDVLAINEAQQYGAAIHRAARDLGHALIRRTSEPGMNHQALLIRRGRTAEQVWHKAVGRASTWRTVRGGTTPPKWILTALVADTDVADRSTGLRVAVGHRPPTQRWRRRRGLWRMTGPARRVLATRRHAVAEVAFLRGRPTYRACLYVADFNATPAIGGRWSPAWVARRVGGFLIAPKEGTHRG